MADTKKIKNLVTVEDLFKFCQMQSFARFSSEETGYRLGVHVPTLFEEVETDENHKGMLKLKIKVFHEGLNRNGSFVSHEAAEKAMLTIPDKPLLGAIHQLDSGEWDFEGHEMEEIIHEDGTSEMHYIESQIGSFTASEPAFWEYDEENDKNFVCAYAYVSEEYTKAADIIRRKNGTKHSAELFIDELSYNAKENYLNLIDFYFNGGTLLGARKDGTQIGEGMLGSRADIVDFSENNNTTRKEETDMEIEETFETNEQIDINQEVVSENEEETPAEAEVTETNDETPEVVEAEEGEAGEPVAETSTEEEPIAEQQESANEPEKFTKTFELSHDDIRYGLYNLLSAYESSDDDWYYISAVYDDHFVYESWRNGNIWGQNYSKNEDSLSFEGERFELFRELLTASEKAELESMRANYSLILSQLKDYQSKEEINNKKKLMSSDEWASVAEVEDFIALKKSVDEEKDGLSFAELQAKANNIQLEAAKAGKLKFSAEEAPTKKVTGIRIPKSTNKAKKNFGNLFEGVL